MRTTLTLDPDVAARLDELRKARKLSLKAAVNSALREGLDRLARPTSTPSPFHTDSVDLGQCFLNRVDDVAEALSAGEGDTFK